MSSNTLDLAERDGTARVAPVGARMVIIVAIMALTNMLNAMDRQIFPILAPQIRSHFDFSIEQTGLLTTVFTLGIGLAALPAGMLGDRRRRKGIIVVSVVIFSAGSAMQAIAVGFGDMLVYRILSGIGEGTQNAVLFAVAGTFFQHHRTMAIGTLTAAYGLGAASSPLLGAGLMGATGHWQVPLITLGLFGILVCLLWAYVPSEVTEARDERIAPSTPLTPQPRRLETVFTPDVIKLCLLATITGLVIYAYLGLYPTFVITQHGFTAHRAAFAASMFGLGGLAAIPLGAVADRVNQKILNLVALVGFMLVGSAVFLAPGGLPVQAVLSALMGVLFTGVVYPNTMSLMQTSISGDRVALATGLFVTCLYVPASISGYLFAFAVVHTGWHVAGVGLMGGLSLIALLVMCTYRSSSRPN